MREQSDKYAVIEYAIDALCAAMLPQAMEMTRDPCDSEMPSIASSVRSCRSYAIDHGEYTESYYMLCALLELHPFVLTGPQAIELLKCGLLLRHKSDDPQDAMFDFRTA